jgi:hypothetical protein
MGKNTRIDIAVGVMLVVVAMLGSLQPAKAYLANECFLGIGVAVCAPMAVNPDARIIRLNDEVEDTPRANARRREWREYCQPRIVRDLDTGMRRYVYAAKGCEFGP